MQLTSEQIEELMGAVVHHECDITTVPVFYSGHVWTPNGAYVRFYSPYMMKYYEKPITWERLTEAAMEHGLTQIATFFKVYYRFLFRGPLDDFFD